MNRELITVIDQIGREKGIDKARIIGAVESALQTAAKKRFGQGENIQVQMDTKTGEISVISLRTIVETVINPKAEVSLTEARRIDTGAEIGDEIGSLIEMDELGRIAAQTAKQVICQKVREAEWEAVLKEYSTRQGDLINGIIMGQERRNYLVDLGKTEAVLPASEQIPRESYRRGDRIKASSSRFEKLPKTSKSFFLAPILSSWGSYSRLKCLRSRRKIVEIKWRCARARRSHEDRRVFPRQSRGSGRGLRRHQGVACPGRRSRVARRKNRYYCLDLRSTRLHRRSTRIRPRSKRSASMKRRSRRSSSWRILNCR